MRVEPLLLAIIAIALFFDFSNGFHDCANAVSTIIGTRAMDPRQAIFMSAALNLIGPFLVGTAVAHTIGSGVIVQNVVTPTLLFSALVGAIAWNLFTWREGIPSSSSHALIGGLAGAAIAAAGLGSINVGGLDKIFLSLLLSPLAGVAFGLLLAGAIMRVFVRHHPQRTNALFKKLQILSSAAISLSHGSNDAQKTMGIIALALVAFKENAAFTVDPWVIFACAGAMALGTALGGWRIIRTMSHKMVDLKPFVGFSAETSSAIVIFIGSLLGLPISTTHVVSSSIVGAGMAASPGRVRLGVARNIAYAWVLTLPASALVAGIAYFAMRALIGA